MPRYALVIGIQKYSGSGFQDLEKSAHDAEAVAQLLENHGDWIVKRLPESWNGEQECLEVATDSALTGRELGTEIRQFFDRAGRDEALVYFSGHGYEAVDNAGEKAGYLVASDCTVSTVRDQGIALSSLNKIILNAECSSVVVLLDCCHAGSLLEKGLIDQELTAFHRRDRRYFLAAACRGHEKAYEGPEYSLFTKALLDGLAKPGRNGQVLTSQVDLSLSEGLRGSGQEPVVLKYRDITLVTYGDGTANLPEKDALESVLDRLCVEGNYDSLDEAFFEAVKDRVASNQARAQVLRLRAANWSMLFQGNYVERDQQGEALRQAQRLAQQPGISLMVIRGEPGAGKTALLRWLAHELFCQGKRVLHKKGTSQAGWLEELWAVSEAAGGEHFYVIADDVFRDETILEELNQTELWFSLTLIVTTRPNEDCHTELDGTDYETVCLDLNRPSQTEKERILALPEVQSHLADKSQGERESLLDSPIMLVLMLQLSEGKPFDTLLQDIVKGLPSNNDKPIYQAFGALCSFFQYGIIVPFEILRLCLPVGTWSEQLILTDLEGLVDTATYGGYEGLFPVHELIAKTVMELDYKPGNSNQPYVWLQPPLLEQNLRKIIPALDANKDIQQRWLRISFRVLLSMGLADFINQVLREYHPEILAIQSQSSISDLFYWARVYRSIDWVEEQNRCTNDLLIRQPQKSYDWIFWFSQISKLGSHSQKQTVISAAQVWLEEHPEEADVHARYLIFLSWWGTSEQKREAITIIQTWLEDHPKSNFVRGQYLSFLSQWGTPEQNQDAIATTQSWLEDHPEDTNVRGQYLAFLSQWGTPEQKWEAIATTQTWLEDYSENTSVRGQYLTFLRQWGTPEQKREAISTTQTWLEDHPENTNVREQYLAFLSQWGTPEQKREAIATTQTWLEDHPESNFVRGQYLVFLGKWGTPEQKREAIATTQTWLEDHPEDTNVREQYLAFLRQWGTPEQKRETIATIQTWLEDHLENTNVRTQFLAFIGKQKCDIENIADLIAQQWQWISKQFQVDQALWTAFLPVLFHHASPEIYQPAVALSLRHHPDSPQLKNLIFGYFYDYLDHVTCYALADHISQSRLPSDKWRGYIYAANFFRDQGEFEKAERIYRRTFGAARYQVSQVPSLAKAIDFINLSYAQLLLRTNPPQPDQAIKKLDFVLKKNPKHGYAHLLMAQAFQAKGKSFYVRAKNHFEKAINFDQWSNGYMLCQLGCFYRYAVDKVPAARDCFEKSVAQQVNLPACVELAELEVADGNLEQAKSLVEQGLAVPLLKRTEQDMRDKLSDRIAVLQQQTGLRPISPQQ